MSRFCVVLIGCALLASLAACGPDTTPGVGCGSGFSLCGGGCVNLRDDTRNCGACGRTCAVGQTCSTYTCGSPQPASCSAFNPSGVCPSGQTCSAGACVTPSSPCGPSNPTGTCPSGQTCSGGACLIPSSPCSLANPAGACPSGQTCVAGACCSEASACGAVCCSAGSVCFADRSGNRSCAQRCDTSSECPASASCCATLVNAAGADIGYGVCSAFVAGVTFCRCSSGTECGSSGGCTPLVGTDGVPRRPYVCTANGCGPYQRCTGLGSCPNGYCNLCDAQGRCYCAQVCTSAAMCGGAAGAACTTLTSSNGACSASQAVCVAR